MNKPGGVMARTYKGFNFNDLKYPNESLPYYKNCAALAFAEVLEVNWRCVVNLFVAQGWIGTPKGLEYDSGIARVLKKLTFTKKASNVTWGQLKPKLKTYGLGRYFAINTEGHDFGGNGIGHAVAIMINNTGGWSMHGNNSETLVGKGHKHKKGSYLNGLNNAHKFSVWGPA